METIINNNVLYLIYSMVTIINNTVIYLDSAKRLYFIAFKKVTMQGSGYVNISLIVVIISQSIRIPKDYIVYLSRFIFICQLQVNKIGRGNER